MTKIRDVAVKVEASVYDNRRSMFFRVIAGTAKDPTTGENYECCTAVAGGSPIITMPDGRVVTFSWQTLIEAAREACSDGASMAFEREQSEVFGRKPSSLLDDLKNEAKRRGLT